MLGQSCALSLCLLLAVCLPSQPARALNVAQGTPAGFEQLDAPHATAVTLRWGGETLGLFPAVMTPRELKFTTPDAILAKLPAADVEALHAALTQPMPVHAELICAPRQTENCGLLKPEAAGVIFDESRLSAELFVHPLLLKAPDAEAGRYLPLPEQRFSSVASINGAVSGTDAGSPNFAVTGNAVAAYGESRFSTLTTVSNRGLRFDTALAGVDRQGWAAGGGLFRSRPMQLIPDRDMAGVGVATSTRTLVDAHKTEGNALLVFLPRRAFVSLYREGRLYTSRAYEAGNQLIDTGELPEGAYTVTLRIQEADGTMREEQRFFAKSPDLPPEDAPVYYAQGGVLRKTAAMDETLPRLTGQPILRAGTVRRVSDNLGVSAGLLGLKDRAALETGSFLMFGRAQLRGSVLASTAGDAGVQLSYFQTLERFSAAFDARRVWAGRAMPMDEMLLNNLTQASGTLGYALTPALTIGARGSYSRVGRPAGSLGYGPYADWRLWQEGESQLTFTADAARTADSDGRSRSKGAVLLRFSHRIGQYGITGSAGGNFGSGAGGQGGLRVWRDSVTPGSTLLMGGGVQGDNRSRSVNADADWRGSMGQLRGGVQRSFGQGDGLAYGGNFAVNLAQSGDALHVGGSQNDLSAVVVDTAGDATGQMRIFVDGGERGSVDIGSRQVLYLSPYRRYKIHLAPALAGGSLLDYDNAPQAVTLYPGNVATLHWEIHRFTVLVGHLVDANGTPLAEATLTQGRAQVATDRQGRFQAELPPTERLGFTLKEGGGCEVVLPKVRAINGVLLYKRPLVCR